MSITPIITFKAGKCDVDRSSSPPRVTADAQQGYIYLYAEDDLIHFCWRPRSVPLDEPPLDLVMVPTDGNFVPYNAKSSGQPTAKTNGRIFVLKFSSSPDRHLFWLQSKPQSSHGDAAWYSPRDRKIGDIVDRLLQGEEVDVNRELASVRNTNDDSQPDEDDDDETMDDVPVHGSANAPHQGGSGGAGPGATGGDVREEGEDAREGGADGARAASSSAPDAATVVRNLLESLRNQPGLAPQQQQQQQQQGEGKLYPTLVDLLDTSLTVPMIDDASDAFIDNLLGFLPPAVLLLTHQQGADGDTIPAEPSAELAAAARAAMSREEKTALLKKVLRSPQFHQSLASLTTALRDGGLPAVADALGVTVENGGFVRGGTMPLGGGEAVQAFVEGVKKEVQEKQQ